MDFKTLVHRFGILFSFCGVTPFKLTVESVQKRKIWVEMLPAFIHFLFIVALLSAAIYNPRFQFNNGKVYTLVDCTRLSAEFSLQLAIIAQGLVFRGKMKKLYRDYDSVQKHLQARMEYTVDFNVLRKRLHQLIVTVVVPYFAVYAYRRTLLTRENLFSIIINVLALFYLLASFAQLHVIAHVELLRFTLTQMTCWLRERLLEFSITALCERKNPARIQRLNCYNRILQLKFLHFKLWKLSVDFKRNFGWSLTAIILRNTIEISFGAYTICLHVIKGTPHRTLTRKSIVLLVPNIFLSKSDMIILCLFMILQDIFSFICPPSPQQ